jgi:hypothetical protein
MRKKSVLRGIIAELLKEEDLIADPDLEGEDSLDAQVDRYFSDFEAEASNAKNEAFDFRMLTRRFLLEAGEDEEEEEETEEPEGEEGEEDAEGGDDELGLEDIGDEETEEEPDLLKAEDIDMTSFVGGVMRLVDNYDNLLEMRNTLLRRAAKFIKDKYEPAALQDFKNELLESFGAEIGKSDKDKEDDIDVPGAARASGSVEGGG